MLYNSDCMCVYSDCMCVCNDLNYKLYSPIEIFILNIICCVYDFICMARLKVYNFMLLIVLYS